MKKKLEAIIKELERCARLNESDANSRRTSDDDYEAPHAGIVAGEQRRMLRILRALHKECK